MSKSRQEHEDKLRKLGLPVDLAGRSGFPVGDPRLDKMIEEKFYQK